MQLLFLIAGIAIGLAGALLLARRPGRRPAGDGVEARLARLSHDLRTPIASIAAYAEILEDEEESDPGTRRRFLGIIREECSRMLDMIEGLSGTPATGASAGMEPGGRDPSGGPARGTVLVVDDDPFLVGATRNLLLREGFRALSAGGGREALERARRERPDVILMDLSMPEPGGMGGEEALRALREDPETRSIPVIITTGRTGMEAPAGAAAILTKPIPRETLISTLGRVLDCSPGGGAP